MAKITITVEDLPGDKVKIEATPNMATMVMMNQSGEQMTSAHGYAFRMLNIFRELVKESERKRESKLYIPNN